MFGMLGAILASNMRSGRNFLEVMNHPGTRTVLILLAINLGLGLLLPMVSNSAHMGGLIGGFIVTFCFLDRGRFKADATSRAIQGGWIALLVSLILYTMLPVLRWDYNLKQALRSGDPKLAATYERAADTDRSLAQELTEGRFEGQTMTIAQMLRAELKDWDEAVARWERGN